MGLEGAEVVNGYGGTLGQQLCQRASQKTEGTDAGACGEGGVHCVHLTRQLLVLNRNEVNCSQVPRRWLPVLARRVLTNDIFNY